MSSGEKSQFFVDKNKIEFGVNRWHGTQVLECDSSEAILILLKAILVPFHTCFTLFL
jgi:hypothetical protein